MRRAVVIGCPGSGKSTFARALRDITGLPLCHLDMLFWNKDKTTVSRELFDRQLDGVLSEPEWIIDGNYGRTMERRLKVCDTVFFLDLPTELCLEGIRKRRGKPRPDMPWTEEGQDEEFERFVRDFYTQNRPQITELLEIYKDKNITVFKTHAEAESYLQSLKNKGGRHG